MATVRSCYGQLGTIDASSASSSTICSSTASHSGSIRMATEYAAMNGSRASVQRSASNAISPQPSLSLGEDPDAYINLQIFVPELQVQKCLTVHLDEVIWDIKRKLFNALQQQLPQSFNFGLFLPPCDGRAGKFLLEDRTIREYPFHDCVPYLELKYKKRVYKMLKLDEKALKQLHSKSNLKKFMENVQQKQAEKVEKMCTQGLDPNFHDSQGETPLTLASGVPNNREVLIQLVGGGAHLDFRNSEGQTGMHKAAFLGLLENVKTLLELGGSPNFRDPIGLTPLYYCMLTTDSQDGVAELLLSEAADVGVTDMHGNHEIHQACKNGLKKHVEHLLYYGADINVQNVNGNSPLHVCAVNNRAECARVLLFRGADPNLVNKQCQTALHVAKIVGNPAVAEVIQGHNPSNAVPYRGTPKYNTRRRMTNPILRRRSLSQSSICSAQSELYKVPQQIRQAPSISAPSPSPSSVTICASNASEYGTLRRYAPDAIQPAMAGFESNIPRILVIPRGPKGFGFILRGAKHVDSEVEFEPTPMVPALQFFEGVDMSGMAMKAGLRPGDFLLEINGIDVRRASHEQVVHLIHQADDTITLKVITIDLPPPVTSHYAAGGTLQRRNHSVPRSGLAPAPPQRHPSTSLSFARATPVQHAMGYSTDDNYGFGPHASSTSSSSNPSTSTINHNGYPIPSLATTLISDGVALTNSVDYDFHYHQQRMNGAKSTETLHFAGGSDVYGPEGTVHASELSEQTRCASVKSRPTAARRISAAELEHLMVRQQGTSAATQFQPIPFDQESLNGQTPKKYTSVADMKRRKQRGAPSPMLNGLPRMNPQEMIAVGNGGYYQSGVSYQPTSQLKSFNSSPDLQSRDYDHARKMSTDSTIYASNGDYSRPFKPVLRPKTPPPPPPPNTLRPEPIYGAPPVSKSSENPKQIYNSGMASSAVVSPPPPPPPPPPPDFLKSTPSQKLSAAPNPPAESKGDCRGISAEALSNVKLKPIQNGASSSSLQSQLSQSGSMSSVKSVTPSMGKKSLDFEADLRNALAKRRSKVCQDEEETSEDGSGTATPVAFPQPTSSTENGVTTVGRYGGLSLRESVRQNVENPSKNVSKLQQHSPSNGFAHKKDSGYTSSRTSLEPSEYGDEPQQQNSNPVATTIRIPSPPSNTDMPPAKTPSSEYMLNGSSGHRVTLISQQLEDSYGQIQRNSKNIQQDNISVTSDASSRSNYAENGYITVIPSTGNGAIYRRPMYFENPVRTPPVDYEDPDSGTGDSDHSDTASATTISSSTNPSNGGEFQRKELATWDVADVADWLMQLQLEDYIAQFVAQRVTGSDLLVANRARFTQLGVTRISHRQIIEASLKSFLSN
uniref:Uncharacterized protein n=1 Tax=Acrobeloides nanus TaxID=290746 RepID=A0A914D2E5_9BILA